MNIKPIEALEHLAELPRRDFLRLAGAAGLCAGMPAITGCAADPAADTVCRIVIVGGGAAGISVAARLVRRLKKALITIIDPEVRHYYQPGFTFIGAGVWKPDSVWMLEKDLIPSGVKWLRDRVTAIDPEKRLVRTQGGAGESYDFLVLAPGLQQNWSEIQGISQETLGEGNAHSIYDFDGSVKTRDAMLRFVRDGGRGLFTDTWTKLKCGGAPKKICLLTEHKARLQGARGKLSLKYFTASKALYDVPHYTPRLLEIYRERDIPITCNMKLTGVDTAAKKAYFEDRLSGAKSVEEYDFLHFAPPQSAPDFVRESGLGWTEGKLAKGSWAMVDKKTLIHLKHPNVIALGDVAGIPTSKTSAAIRKQAPIVVDNLCALIAGRAPTAVYDGYAACPIITDFGHVLMAEFDYEKKPASSFPFSLLDTSRELRSAWLLKMYVLKPLYFHAMLRGLA